MGLTEEERIWIEGLNNKLETNLLAQFTDRMKDLNQTIAVQNQTIADLKQENQTMRERLIANDIRVDDLEQYGRRMNIRIEGLPWAEGETVDDLQRTIIDEVGKQGVVLKPCDIVRLHRSSRAKEQDGVVTKQAIVKLATWKARERFLGFNKSARQYEKRTRLKKFTCRVNNDLTKRRLQLLTEARNQIKSHLSQRFTKEQLEGGLADSENVFAYSNINSELRMRIRGKVVSFNTLGEMRLRIDEAFAVIPQVA